MSGARQHPTGEPLEGNIQEQIVAKLVEKWRTAGVAEKDIAFARQTGIDARDVSALRRASREIGVIIVARPPKRTALPWHELLPPKPESIKQKSSISGVSAGPDVLLVVSDIDLLLHLSKEKCMFWNRRQHVRLSMLNTVWIGLTTIQVDTSIPQCCIKKMPHNK